MHEMTIRLIAVLLLVVAGVAHAAAPLLPGAEWMLEEVKLLSAPDMDGRGSGTPGAERAARHIADIFRAAGLRPGGDGGRGYLQAFTVPTGTRLGTGNTLAMLTPTARSFTLGTDFTPLAVSTDGVAEGELVFAGYGITAPDLQYDDYAGLEARDRIVIVLTGDPRADDPAGPFRRPEAYHYSQRTHKIINAREHGARGILLVSHPRESEALPALRGLSQPHDILAAFVTRRAADTLLSPSGRSVAELATAIDRALAPQSFALAGVRARGEIALVRKRATTANVIGILPGDDAHLRDEAIVIGAHYDHLGHGGEGSLAPESIGQVHPGADDNASGTTLVLALARAFGASGSRPRTLVFATFAGEELGLLGSAYYVTHPPIPLARTVLMLNADMVGHLREGRLYVGGVDSGTGLRGVVNDAAQGLGLALELRPSPFGPSDHTSFYTAGRPVLFLFTGPHDDYHRPSDTWDKINALGLATVATLAARVVDTVARAGTPPTWVKVDAPASSAGPRGSGYGAYFGVVPDFGGSSGDGAPAGVRISGVRPGSPAEKAGLKGGDVIVRFAGVNVRTLEDLTFALRGRRAGDQVQVVVRRDGNEQPLQAVLEERR
jgi:aminopeptidase YwaD